MVVASIKLLWLLNLLVTWIEDRSWMRYWQCMKMYLCNSIEVDVISSLICWHTDWAYIASHDFDGRGLIISPFILWWASRIVNKCARQHWKWEASVEYNTIIQRDISNDMFITENDPWEIKWMSVHLCMKRWNWWKVIINRLMLLAKGECFVVQSVESKV